MLGNLVQEAKEVLRGQEGLGVPEVQLVNQVPRAHQAMTGHPVHLEREDLKDLRDLLVFQDQRVPLDHLARMGCLDTLVSEEKRVSKVKLVHLVLEVSSALRAQLERLVQLENEVTLDLQDPLENKVYQVLQARRVQRETQVLRALLEKMVHLD